MTVALRENGFFFVPSAWPVGAYNVATRTLVVLWGVPTGLLQDETCDINIRHPHKVQETPPRAAFAFRTTRELGAHTRPRTFYFFFLPLQKCA